MKQIYLVRTMNLIGQVFKIYNKFSVKSIDETRSTSDGRITTIYFTNLDGVKESISECRYFNLQLACNGTDMDEEELLPYFADVTEDLPGWAKWKPKKYKNCQLTTDYPNGYLVFLHKPTGKRLKIAMNSHSYEPVSK